MLRPKPQLHALPKPPAEPQPQPMAVLPQADTLFFDAAPVFSHSQGVVSVTLSTRRYLPDGKGGVMEQDVVVGFLRCGVKAAQSLHQAIESALLLARPTQGMPSN